MKFRTALFCTLATVLAMVGMQHWVAARIQWAISTGWELPRWFRFLASLTFFWSRYWWFLTILILAFFITIVNLTAPGAKADSRRPVK